MQTSYGKKPFQIVLEKPVPSYCKLKRLPIRTKVNDKMIDGIASSVRRKLNLTVQPNMKACKY